MGGFFLTVMKTGGLFSNPTYHIRGEYNPFTKDRSRTSQVMTVVIVGQSCISNFNSLQMALGDSKTPNHHHPFKKTLRTTVNETTLTQQKTMPVKTPPIDSPPKKSQTSFVEWPWPPGFLMHDVVSDLCHASSLDAWRRSKVSAVSGTEGGRWCWFCT